jgi:cytochrome o ubiquinol oxidase subunit 1
VILGVLAGLLGFAMIWYIWWLAIAAGVGIWAVIIARAYDDDAEYCLPASEVEKIEAGRYQALANSARTQSANEPIFSNQPLPESLT